MSISAAATATPDTVAQSAAQTLAETAPRNAPRAAPDAGTSRAIGTLGLMVISGMVATVVFDLWGQIISPALGFANLSPHGLARSLLGTFGLPNGDFAGYFVHFYLVGLIGYPVGWLFIFRPAWQAVVGSLGGWFVPSLVYGFGLWIFAIGGITAIAGLPFFLNFTGITWVALVGHVLYGVAMVAVMQAIVRR